MLKMAMATAAALVLAAPGLALAAPSTLQLIIGGEAYDGPPKFEVTFDGKVLGEGTVSAAIDTASVGRFASAADKSAYVQSFTFNVPDDVFKPDGDVRVRFLNEAYGGDGSNRDRNLYLAAITVNGRAVTLSGLSTQGTSANTRNETLGEFLVLKDGNVEGVSHAPAGGWPEPGTETAAVEQVPDAGVPAIQAPPTPAPVAGIKPVVAAAPNPAAEAPAAPETDAAAVPPATAATTTPPGQLAAVTPAAAAPDAEKAPDPTVTASIDQKPETNVEDDVAAATRTASIETTGSDAAPENPNCNRDEKYNVIGFNDSSNELTIRLKSRLDQIVADIGNQECKVLVTGYSSKGGDNATSALFAIERAQHVVTYLRDKGLKFERVAATGGGATDAFGPTLAANRRVVITVSP